MQNNPEANQFRYEPIEYPDEMKALFDGIIATGKDAWCPSKNGLPTDGIESCKEAFVNIEPGEPSSTTNKQKYDIKHEGKRVKKNKDDKVIDIDAQLLAAINVLEKSDGPSIEECNKILDELDTLEMNDPRYIAATLIFCEGKAHREQWINLKNKPENIRLKWIEMSAKKLGIL